MSKCKVKDYQCNYSGCVCSIELIIMVAIRTCGKALFGSDFLPQAFLGRKPTKCGACKYFNPFVQCGC